MVILILKFGLYLSLISGFALLILSLYNMAFKANQTLSRRAIFKKPSLIISRSQTTTESNLRRLMAKINERIYVLLSSSGTNYSLKSLYVTCLSLFFISFAAIQFLVNIFMFSLLTSLIIALLPLLLMFDKHNKAYKRSARETKKFILGCLEASNVFDTPRDIVRKGCVGTELEELVLLYTSSYDIRTHDSLLEISRRRDDTSLFLFSTVIKQAEISGSNMNAVISAFNKTVSLAEDTNFIKKLNIIEATSQFKVAFVIYLSNIAFYKFVMPEAMSFFYTPSGSFILTLSIILVITNIILLLWEIFKK